MKSDRLGHLRPGNHCSSTAKPDDCETLLAPLALIEHPPSVVLVVSEGDQLVVVRQHRAGASGDVLELPAGTLEPGETVRECADRELGEECGLAVSQWAELGSFWAAPAYSTEKVTVLAGETSGTAIATPDPDESIVVERIPAGDAATRLEDAASLAALALVSERPASARA
jgi:ADP-ribose pyrophosphatase